MKISHYSRFVSLIAISLFSLVIYGQVSPTIGQLPIRNYNSKIYKASPQNWAIVQDLNGLMYFGNSEGVLIFDGINWNLVAVSNESTVHSLDVSPKGSIYVGAVGDFGYLTCDKYGQYQYVSLQELYKVDPEDIGDVLHVNAFDDGVYFMTTRHIFFYNGKSMKVWDSESAFQTAYSVNGKYIVNQLSTGLCELVSDSLIPLSNVNDFKNTRIYDIVRYSENDMLVLTEKRGVYQFYKNSTSSGKIEDYRVKIDTEIQDLHPYNGLIIDHGILSIGTWGHGLLLVDEEGDIVQRVNSEYGLNDEVINAQYLDAERNLWLATSNGISVISLNKRISAFANMTNINETVEAITEYDNKVFVASHTGLFYWDKELKSSEFKKVEDLNEECWGLLSYKKDDKDVLLIAGNNAIYELREDMKVRRLSDSYPWTFLHFKKDPSLVFVGLDDGLVCLSNMDKEWTVKEKVPGINYTIHSMVESTDDELWLGSPNRATKLSMEWIRSVGAHRFKLEEYSSKDGLPDGDIYVEMMGEELLFGTSQGIYSFNEDSMSFKKEEEFEKAFGDRPFQVHRLSYQKNGKLWMSAYFNDEFYLGYFQDSGNELTWVNNDFLPYSEEVFHAIYHDESGNTWLGGPNGVLLYQGEKDLKGESIEEDLQVLIRNVVLNNDSINFYGNIATLNYGDTSTEMSNRMIYPYYFNSISFNFSSQSYKYPEYNEYSFKLEGFIDSWSEWNTDPKAVYTNLSEGYYKFLVKTRNAYGTESAVTEFTFKVDPPWYRTWWAYFIYMVLAILIVWAIVSMYTQNLKEVIKEKTAEVVAQKDKIEKQKNEVEEQRHLLEVKNADITSSINYARRLQQAILPEEALIKKHLPEAFILYKPKDIVSGDFYWMDHVNGATGHDVTLFAAVDCTGHGVPGAFVSVVGNGGLNRAVNEFGLVEPASILEKLNEIVVDTLSKGEQDVRDGMDISLCSFDFNKMEMQFAGANNSAYLVRRNVSSMDLGLNGEGKYYKEDLLEIKPNKQPVGYYEFKEAFVNHKIDLEKGDMIYLFSDGFADQFGGPRCKKYNYPRFKDFLISISDKTIDEQKVLIEGEFEEWKGSEEQIDDVIVAGIRV